MIVTDFYIYIVLSIAGGLLALLSSVGIFISIIVQRRLDRLQEILEEFINLSYRREINLTGLMYNLIEKYQMNYIFPQKPHFLILRYIDANIFFILLLWSASLFCFFQPPLNPIILIQLVPLFIGIFASLFFRLLLRNTLSLENPLLETIIPAPRKMRSISYLSHFINLSVKSVLMQARLTLYVELSQADELTAIAKVLLKEELSCDDFFYYVVLEQKEETRFISFGEIIFHFAPDPITGKPVPVCRNLNIPFGHFMTERSPENMTADLLIFARGEKHPIQYTYHLTEGTGFFSSLSNPNIVVNHQIIYTIAGKEIKILANNAGIPYLDKLSTYFNFDAKRYFMEPSADQDFSLLIRQCAEEVFID